MRQIGPFLHSLQEDVAFCRHDPLDGTQTDVLTGRAWVDYASAMKVKAIVLTDRILTTEDAMLIEDNRFSARLSPPRSELRIGDELYRPTSGVGRRNMPILLVTEISILRDIQRLRLEDRNQVVQ